MIATSMIAAASSWLLAWLLHSTLLIGAVWWFSRLGRPRAPELREALWLAAGFGAFLTASVVSPQPPAGTGTGVALDAVILLAAVLAASAGLWRLRARLRVTREALESACPLRDLEFLRASLAVARRAGLERPPHLLESPALPLPSVLAGLIVLPAEDGEERPTPAQAEAIVAHELAHLLRGDAVRAFAVELLHALFPVQPLLAAVTSGVVDTSELLADEVAVGWTGRPVVLARVLERAARKVAGVGRAAGAHGIGGPGRQSRIEERIRRLLSLGDHRCSSFLCRGVGRVAVAAGLVLPLLIAGPRLRFTPGAQSDERVVVELSYSTEEIGAFGPGAPGKRTLHIRRRAIGVVPERSGP